MKGSYQDPQYNVNMGAQVNLPAVAAEAVAGKFVAFAASKIKSIRGVVVVAGTNGTAGYSVLNGTTVVGAVVCGTSTAGVKVTGSVTEANATLASGDVLDFKATANGATMAAAVVVEYEIVSMAEVS